jgi:hypothetical protein
MTIPIKHNLALFMVVLLTACGGGGGDGSGGTTTQSLHASGQITDASDGGSPIPSALVDVQLSSSNPSGNSSSDGRYSVTLPNNGLPQFLIGTVNKADYLPGTVLFKFANGQLDALNPGSNNAALIPIDTDTDVVFASGLTVVHLGDDDFNGSANSQLQAPLTGKIWKDSFELNGSQKDANSQLVVTLYARGVETPAYCDKIVLGNNLDSDGNVIGDMSQNLSTSNPDGSFTQITHTFLLSGLVAGTVYLQIISGKQCANSSLDDDDFEISTVLGKLS